MDKVCTRLTKETNKFLNKALVSHNPLQGYVLEYRVEGEHILTPLGRTARAANKCLKSIQSKIQK